MTGTMNQPPGRSSGKSVPPEGCPQFSACPVAALALPRTEADSIACRKAPMVGSENKEKEITMSQPSHRIRRGVLQVTIWRNSGEKGTWYSVIPSRGYKQGDD